MEDEIQLEKHNTKRTGVDLMVKGQRRQDARVFSSFCLLAVLYLLLSNKVSRSSPTVNDFVYEELLGAAMSRRVEHVKAYLHSIHI
jgi:hypothetical protein